MSWVRIGSPARRDRLWLLNAFAVVLLNLLGAAGEALGYDRHLKANTAKQRTRSLSPRLYALRSHPNMPDRRLRPLMQRFGEMLLEHRAFSQVFGLI